MKKFIITIVAVSAITFVFAQQSETRNVGSFNGVKASEGIDVYVKSGDKEAVKVEVSGNITPSDVLTEISGSYLKIHLKEGNHRNVDVKVYVTYVKLDKLSASSAGSIYSDGKIKSGSMEISASSAGVIEVSVEANDVSATSSSAGDIEITGKVKEFAAESSSAGQIDADELEAESVMVEASSGGSAKVFATRELEADASSGGSIRYRGNPEKSNTESSSGGSVKKAN